MSFTLVVSEDGVSFAEINHWTAGEGAAASQHLFQKLGIKDGDKVVDFGCGLGGPARSCIAFGLIRCTLTDIICFQAEIQKMD